MNLTSSHPFWSVRNGLPANYPSLRRDVSCDAVVIGGGITGALAVHLVEAGVEALLIDKRDIGTGGTSASTALLAAIPTPRPPASGASKVTRYGMDDDLGMLASGPKWCPCSLCLLSERGAPIARWGAAALSADQQDLVNPLAGHHAGTERELPLEA